MQRIEIFQILYLWKIVVYNMRDVANVEAARRHRRRHQQRHPSSLQCNRSNLELLSGRISVENEKLTLKSANASSRSRCNRSPWIDVVGN